MSDAKATVGRSGAIGFAVLGFGRMGQRHASLIRANPDSSLVAVADISPGGSSAAEPFFSSLESLLSSSLAKEIDIVSIATPNGLHAAHACTCLEAGKHVLVEKPVALKSVDVHRMLDIARNRNLRVFPVLQNRFAPGAVWLKELVASGRLGRMYMAQVDCFWNRDGRYYDGGGWHGTPELDGGVLFTQFSHFVDLLYWLLGDIGDIRSHIIEARPRNDIAFADTGTVQFRLAEGGVGCLNFSTAVWDKNMESGITLIAENGSVKVGGQHLDKLDYCHMRGTQVPFPSAGGAASTDSNLRLMLTSVVDVLKGRAEPLVEADDAAKVVGIIESMYAS